MADLDKLDFFDSTEFAHYVTLMHMNVQYFSP